MPSLVHFTTIPELFTRLVARFDGQNHAALAYKDKKTKAWTDITWEQLRDDVHAFSGYLHKRGIRKGDRVAILSENRPEWAVTDLATQMLGAVNVSLYTTLPAAQVGYIVKDSGSKLLVVSTAIQLRKGEEVYDACPELEGLIALEPKKETSERVVAWDAAMDEGRAHYAAHRDEIDAMAKAVHPEDLCALIYTSGTTGVPKGVMLTHHNFSSNVVSALDRLDFGPDDHHLSFLPLCHSFERTAGYTGMMACGAKITYAESVDAVSKNLPEVKPTVLISVPRVFEKVYAGVMKGLEGQSATKRRIFDWAVSVGSKAAALDVKGKAPGPLLAMQRRVAHTLVFSKLHEKLGGNVRFAVSGGAALPKHIGEFFEAAGLRIIEGYGLTETSPILCVNPITAPRFGTVGHVIPGVTVGIEKNGALVAEQRGNAYPSSLTTEEGEIVAQGPNVMKGYWGNDAATREAVDAGGWYHTGDVGRFVDGYLQITDRIKHMIVNKGGKNIYPGPIEDQIKALSPLIEQILVVGEGREYLTALVVPSVDVAKEQFKAASDAEALAHPELAKAITATLRAYSKTAASHEKVRDVRLLDEPFTVENDLMTPTMKPKRKVIEKRHAALIEAMYAAKAGSDDEG